MFSLTVRIDKKTFKYLDKNITIEDIRANS